MAYDDAPDREHHFTRRKDTTMTTREEFHVLHLFGIE
jgi:hypothetical protein